MEILLAVFFLVLFIGIPLVVVGGLMALWIWMIVECATREPDEGNDRLIWILVVVLTGWIGAVIYFFARRPERIRRYGR